MKLYILTEEQIREANHLLIVGEINDIIEVLTPIELPSDGEIAYEAVTWNVYNMTPLEAFRHGVNWTKEQILNQHIK